MTSSNDPVPHECDFCQKMIIGYSNEEKKADDVVFSSSGEQLLQELLALDPDKSLSQQRSMLRHRNMVIFDLTLEAIKATANDCALFAWFIEHMPEDEWLVRHEPRGSINDSPSTFILAAEVHRDILQFGIPSVVEHSSGFHIGTKEKKKEFFIHMHGVGIPLCQMTAARGKSSEKLQLNKAHIRFK